MTFRIASVQQVGEKGALEQNLDRTIQAIRDAAARGVAVIAFLEASLTGHIEIDGYPDGPVALDSSPIRRLVAATRGLPVTALPGLVEMNPNGLPFLTQLVVRDGVLMGLYRKMTIPDDERHLFTPGTKMHVFAHGTTRFGIAICADLGNEQVYADAARMGARIVFEVAAPGLYGDQATRDWQAARSMRTSRVAPSSSRLAENVSSRRRTDRRASLT